MQPYCSTSQVKPQLANTITLSCLLNFVMTVNQKWAFWMDECLYVPKRGSHLRKLISQVMHCKITFKNLLFQNSLIIHKEKKQRN